MPHRQLLSTVVADKPLRDRLVSILNLFQSEDEEADQYWYLLGIELRRLNEEKYDYSVKILVRFGQAEEQAPEELLKDLLHKGAYLEDVVKCLEKLSCKTAVDLLQNNFPRVVVPVEESDRAGHHNGSHAIQHNLLENVSNNLPHIHTDIGTEESTSTSNLHGQEEFTAQMKPVIETQPVPRTANRGSTAEFHCMARPPNCTFTWFKNGCEMKGKLNRKLELTNVGREDEAEYHCIVSNGAGQVVSVKAKLTLASSIEITQQPVSKQVLHICHGKQVIKLNCRARINNSCLEYQWQKLNHKGRPEKSYSVKDTAEVDIPVAYNELNTSRQLTFRCKITDKEDPNDFIYSDKVIVEVKTVWLTRDLKDVHAKILNPTSLRCEGKGFIGCYWLRSTTDVGKPAFYKQTAVPVLYFPHLSQEDEGHYICNMYNDVDHVTTRRAHLRPFINEEVKRVPVLKILGEPRSRVVQSGTPLKLDFQVSCSTEDEMVYQWYLNGIMITGEDSDYLVREEVYEEHCGRYHCEAAVKGVKVTSKEVTVRTFYQEDQSDGASPTQTREVNRTYRYDSAGYRFAHDKVALLIGNMSYHHLVELKSPENDILQLSKILEDLDFKVFALVDLTFSEMQSALSMFYKSLVCNTYALFYFSGHGFNDASQNSYIAPVDCPKSPNLDTCFHMADIVNRMQAQNCRPLCVIDACRLVDFNVSTRPVTGIKDPSNYLSIWSTGDDSAATDTTVEENGQASATSPFNQEFRKAIESGCYISELPNKILTGYDRSGVRQSIDPRGQYRDREISLHDEISVGMAVGVESIVEDLKRIECDYKKCVGVPDSCWLTGSDMKDLSAYAELLLEFSLVLTNVWQLKVTCYLIAGEANSAKVDFDDPFLESQGVEVQQVLLEPREDSHHNICVCAQLKGLQKLKSPLKVVMKVCVHVNGEPKTITLEYETTNTPCIASHFIS